MEFYAAVILLTILTEFHFVTLQCHPIYTSSSYDTQSMLSVVTRSSIFLNVQQQWPTNVDQEVTDDVRIYRLHVTCIEGRVKSRESTSVKGCHGYVLHADQAEIEHIFLFFFPSTAP
jgi:hypothetical protein